MAGGRALGQRERGRGAGGSREAGGGTRLTPPVPAPPPGGRGRARGGGRGVAAVGSSELELGTPAESLPAKGFCCGRLPLRSVTASLNSGNLSSNYKALFEVTAVGELLI